MLAVIGPGRIKSLKTTVLLAPAELQQAQEKAQSATYRGPSS